MSATNSQLRDKTLITIKEVAELAGVSQSTVSRALNGHQSVKPSNKEKVFAAIEKLGYKPNAFAQALASNKSFSIGMLVGTLDGPYYGPLMHNVEEIVRAQNYHLIITSGYESYEREQDSIQFLNAKKVDGFVLIPDMLSDNDILEIVATSPATVVLNRYIPEIADKCIRIDNELGGYLAVDHLVKKGHKKIGCVTGQLSKVDSRERLQGYRNALSAHGIEYNASLVVEGRFDYQENDEAIKRLLNRDPEMSAIFCMNDNIAVMAYNVCKDRGLTVGEDISIIGFDNNNYSQYMSPPLTTINFPIKEMAIQGAKCVLNSLMGRSNDGIDKMLLPTLIERHSVKALS